MEKKANVPQGKLNLHMDCVHAAHISDLAVGYGGGREVLRRSHDAEIF